MTKIIDNRSQLLAVDNSEDEDDLIHDGRRRGSNVSLSRFRSCPQLLDEAENQQAQSFEQTTDDSYAQLRKQMSPFSPLGDTKFFVERNGRLGSETPTPPSSPKSRRSLLSLRESQPAGLNQSPNNTPRLLRRSYFQRSNLSRDSSAESQSGSRPSSLHLTEDNIRHHDLSVDLSQILVAHPDKKSETKLLKSKQIHGEADDTQLKCEQWLQTLNVSKPEKIKSRSHIQLPPI